MSKFKIRDNYLPPLDATHNISVLNTTRSAAAKAWFDIAYENIISAEILLNSKRFPHTVFFIQQTIECLIKGIFSENGIVEPQKASDINHYAFEAFHTYYVEFHDQYGMEFSDLAKQIIDKGDTFSEKLEFCASIANILTTDYNKNIDIRDKQINAEYNPKALGLKEDASQIECHKRIYRLYYFQYILHLLSYIFSHEAESCARYPKISNTNSVLMPSTIFDNKISKNLSQLVILLKHITSEIINDSLNLMFWRCGTAAALS